MTKQEIYERIETLEAEIETSNNRTKMDKKVRNVDAIESEKVYRRVRRNELKYLYKLAMIASMDA